MAGVLIQLWEPMTKMFQVKMTEMFVKKAVPNVAYELQWHALTFSTFIFDLAEVSKKELQKNAND